MVQADLTVLRLLEAYTVKLDRASREPCLRAVGALRGPRHGERGGGGDLRPLLFFGRVHRGVGYKEQLLTAAAILGGNGDTTRDGQRDDRAVGGYIGPCARRRRCARRSFRPPASRFLAAPAQTRRRHSERQDHRSDNSRATRPPHAAARHRRSGGRGHR